MNPQVTHLRPSDFPAQQFQVGADHKLHMLPVSTDANNLVRVGTDGNVYIDAAAIQANQVMFTSAIIGDKLYLYKTVPGVGGAAPVTSQVSVCDLTPLDVTVNGGTFSNGVITLTESNGGAPVQIDISKLISQILTANSASAALTGNGTAASPLSVSVILDTSIAADAKSGLGNLVKITTTGVGVNPSDVLALINANLTHTLSVNAAAGTLNSVVNGVAALPVGLTEVLNLDGSHAGWMLS